jgi:stage V sporulation protein B
MITLPTHKSKKKSALLTTATLVTALSVFERSLGFLYRIVLSRLIGAEGVGLYQVALSLFAVFLTIGTGGIPVTVSRLIAKANAENDEHGKRSAVGAGIFLSLLFTLPVCLILLPLAEHIPNLFSDDRAVPVFQILLIGLCFSSVYAVIRGSFWGEKKFLTPSLIELSEEIVMVISGILLLNSVHSALDGAQKAAWAATASYLFSFTVSTLAFLINGGKISHPKKQLKPLFNATLPITSVRASGTIVNSAIAVLLPVMLIKNGFSESQALRLFGVVSGMAIPVLFIPSTIIGSLSLVLVPELSEDFYKGNFKRLYHNIFRGISLAFLIACFLAPFFFVLGEELGSLAFNEPLAGEYVKKGSFLLLPMSLTMITTGTLNSMGFEKQTFLFYFIGAAGMLLCILLLPPFFGAFSYIIGLFFSYVLTALCNLIFLKKQCKGLFSTLFKNAKPLAFAAILLLPISLLGSLFSVFSHRVFGAFFSSICTGIFLLILTLTLYLLFAIIPRFPLKNRKKIKKTPATRFPNRA